MRNSRDTKLLFELSDRGCRAHRLPACDVPERAIDELLPKSALAATTPALPELSEPQVVRHFVNLSQLNMSVDTHFYPLGSCTMKYNPRACNEYAMLPEFLGRHPLAPESTGQGLMQCLWELQEMLKAVTGMRGVSLTPMAGAQGEFAGVAMIRAYHRARGDEAGRCHDGRKRRRSNRARARPAIAPPAGDARRQTRTCRRRRSTGACHHDSQTQRPRGRRCRCRC